jgi:drug/metabolite transporter (DMT)-like permease
VIPSRLKIYLGISIICILWGSSWAAVKLGLEGMPPLLSLTVRFTMASIILGIIMIFQRQAISKDRNFWKLVCILCVTSFTIPFVLIYLAQIQVSSGLASVLFATFPFWVAILSHFFLINEKISLVRISGLIFGFIGIIFVFYNGLIGESASTFIGMIEIIAAAIIQSSGLILLRRLSMNINPVSLNFCSMSLSIFPLLVGSIFAENYSTVHFDSITLISLSYLSVFCTVVTFVIYFWLIKHIEAVILSLTAFVTPVIAMILGVLFMDEIFTTNTYIGSLLVMIGVIIVTAGDWSISFLSRTNNKNSS